MEKQNHTSTDYKDSFDDEHFKNIEMNLNQLKYGINDPDDNHPNDQIFLFNQTNLKRNEQMNLNQFNFEPTGYEIQIYHSDIDERGHLDELNDYFSKFRFKDHFDEQELNFELEKFDEDNYHFKNEDHDFKYEFKSENEDYQSVSNEYFRNFQLETQDLDFNRSNEPDLNDYQNDFKPTGLELVSYQSEEEEVLINGEFNYDCDDFSHLKENFPIDLNDEQVNNENNFVANLPKLSKKKKKKKKKRMNIRRLLDGDNLIKFNKKETEPIDMNDNGPNSSHTIKLDIYNDNFTCLPDSIFKHLCD